MLISRLVYRARGQFYKRELFKLHHTVLGRSRPAFSIGKWPGGYFKSHVHLSVTTSNLISMVSTGKREQSIITHCTDVPRNTNDGVGY